MANKVIDPAPIIKQLADRCLKAKGLECSILGGVIDLLKSAPAVYNAPYWATEAAYKNGYEKGYEAGKKDAAEVVHGRWERRQTGEMIPLSDTACVPQYAEFCTACNLPNKHYKTPYCPNCGAKMDGDKENA